MPVTHIAPGQISPIMYFVHSSGAISLPPTTEDAHRLRPAMFCRGYSLHSASTLPEAHALQRRLQAQTLRETQSDRANEEFMYSELRRQVRARLYARMNSASTTEYERDFIREYLAQSELKHDAVMRARFRPPDSYFTALEYDGNRGTQHLTDITSRVPDSKDTACKKCGAYRKVQGTDVCIRCAMTAPEALHAQ